MKKSTVILGAVLFAVCIISIFSFAILKKLNIEVQHTERLDNAAVIYEYFTKKYSDGDIAKAEEIANKLIQEYANSELTGQAIKAIAFTYDNADKDQKALYYYRMLINKYPEITGNQEIKEKAEKINSELLHGAKYSSEDIIEYTVQPGDNLFSIARKYNSTIDYIQELNGLKSDMIRAGQKLKVNVAEFSIYVDKFENIMVLKKNGEPFKTYRVATGKNNYTPEGVFKIVDKMIKPPWTRPDGKIIESDNPEYELGERWMPISAPGFGIHGTNKESSIGKQATLGCVRMYNADVIELYNIVPRGTEVEIVDTAKKKEVTGADPEETLNMAASDVIN